MGTFWREILKGSLGPVDNDSRYLLDVHSRELPREKTMRRYPEGDEVDLVIVGADAGGSVLAQRLARRGWRIVVLEAGPLWHPDQDWVFDEAGAPSGGWTAATRSWSCSPATRCSPIVAAGGWGLSR